MENGTGARDEPATKRVAIIGGGLGGLAAAAYLQGATSEDGSSRFTCVLFEAAPRIGGNMFTAYLGDKAYEAPFADLAVNDFNAATYHRLLDLMRTMKTAGYEVPYGNLIDEASFGNGPDPRRRPVSFTTDEVDAPWWHLTRPYLLRLWWDLRRFKASVREVMTVHAYAEMTVAEFVERKGFSAAFRDLMLYPRINAMYFMSGMPGGMPIRGVMYYYLLQEGYGTPVAPDRKFFARGASQWAHQLTEYVKHLGTTVHLGAKASVSRPPGATTPVVTWVQDGRVANDPFDVVVCAVPPSLVRSVVPFFDPAFLAGLEKFGAYAARAYVHTDASVLPVERKRWRTYNVFIPQDGQVHPYTMTYVNAMHCGQDLKEPPFVSESTTPAPGTVLDMVDLAGKPSSPRVPATAEFVHNTVSVDTMKFQAQLGTFQGAQGIYFTGGWTNGAGLQEQILAGAQEVAKRILGHYRPDDHEGYRADDPGHVPPHVRRALGLTPAPGRGAAPRP